MRFANWLHMAVAGGVLVGGALVAHADTFSVSGTLNGQGSYAGQTGTLSGTVSIDLATETVTGSTLSVTGLDLTNVAASTGPGTTFGDYIPSLQIWEFVSGYFPVNPGQLEYALKLYVPTGEVVSKSGGELCSTTFACGSGLLSELQRGPGPIATLQSGKLTPVATTPEPGAMWLVGTGVLGGVGVLRRRFSR